MPQDVTFVEARQRFQSISGLESLTSADAFFLQNSFSRSALNAYHMSNLWPRFLRVNELRSLSSEPVSTVTYTYPESIQIGSTDRPLPSDSPYINPVEVNGLYVLGENINGMPAWYLQDSPTITQYVIAKGADTFNYGLYSYSSLGISFSPVCLFEDTETEIILPKYIPYGTYGLLYSYNPTTGNSTSEASAVNELISFSYGEATSSQTTVMAGDVVPYSELNKDDIGEFIRISKDKAYDIMSTMEYDFYVDSNGANLRNLDPGTESVYVTYKKAYNPSFTEASTDIPQEFLDYMIHIALSDFYMGDGQNERAYAAKGHAERLLTDELYRLEQRKNTNIINTRFFNHHNKQVR